MLATAHISNSNSETPNHFLFSVLENTEVGVVVVNSCGRALYMNSSARELMGMPAGSLPEWAGPGVASILTRVEQTGQAIERWEHEDLVFRVRARRLDQFGGLALLEIRVTASPAGAHAADKLSRSLHITITDGKLLALLWRGLSNDEIAQKLGVRVGTIKSRLFRLYQKLGVKRRPAAVLRAAEVLAA